uniref:Uncharacterized protein n=1 Tax=Thermosporothrix sp. COM3 TaxID=2490863 RepID=A0A455SQ56_9CHLR|nr:hypothetical protein KTC_53140 [Thermosporothrix sp. COM3]
MAMQTPLELFLHELSDMYDAEKRIAQTLPILANESTDQQLKDAYQQHEAETQHHIQNLDQCFQVLGKQPSSTTCYAIAGLKQEHDAFLKEQPTPEILSLFNLGCAAKTEAYEIVSYKGLVEKAAAMGYNKCAQLLQENLGQEEEMARRIEQFAQRLSKTKVTSQQKSSG